MTEPRVLDRAFIERTRRRIEEAILPVMERRYLHDRVSFDESYRPGLKDAEKFVSYYDYEATGISVLAHLYAGGSERAKAVIDRLRATMDHYRRHICGQAVAGRQEWTLPLRRLILHTALAYRHMAAKLTPEERAWFRELADEQVPLAIAHCHDFFPGVSDIHLTSAKNHDALFMQGIFWCGRVFDRPEWMARMNDFARRYFASGHGDGYFEENTNEQREGGPSLVYSRLTAGALFDVLDGRNQPHHKFLACGAFYRQFLDADYAFIPLADERTNSTGRSLNYGTALHTLSPEGRYYVVDLLDRTDYPRLGSEALAVLHHELDLMTEGECAPPENRREGNARLALPLGVVRHRGFVAGLSALKALNRQLRPDSDYALDRQNLIYLSHRDAGVLSPGFKSKRDVSYSTFRIGEDAYPVRTGELAMGDGWAEATAHYDSFDVTLRWDIGERAVLSCTTGDERAVTSMVLLTDEAAVRSEQPHRPVELRGFSPYSAGNQAAGRRALEFTWRKRLMVEFAPG